MDTKINCTAETLKHICRVSKLLNEAASELLKRASCHDASKLESPEAEEFERLTPILKDVSYGTPEYAACLIELSVALKHHYENNSHHPEHYDNGIDGMDLFDIMEMFFDWKASSERHFDGDIYKSIEFGAKRFNISPQLTQIFYNTAKKVGWSQ